MPARKNTGASVKLRWAHVRWCDEAVLGPKEEWYSAQAWGGFRVMKVGVATDYANFWTA